MIAAAADSGPTISANLRIVAIAGGLALLVFIVELVRRRRLKEEYSVLWVATALLLLLLAAWGGLLRDLTHLIGAGSQASALYFFGIIFIVFLLLHFSVRVSNLERRVVVLLQEVALLNERERLASGRSRGAERHYGRSAPDLGAGASGGSPSVSGLDMRTGVLDDDLGAVGEEADAPWPIGRASGKAGAVRRYGPDMTR